MQDDVLQVMESERDGEEARHGDLNSFLESVCPQADDDVGFYRFIAPHLV
jgi:hypothetical protein